MKRKKKLTALLLLCVCVYGCGADHSAYKETTVNLSSAEGVLPEAVQEEDNTVIAEGAYKNDASLESFVIPDTVTSIGKEAFAGSSLKEITIPDSVTEVGDNAFKDCANLEEITLPAGITTIGSGAFMNSGLKNIMIPDGVTLIEPSVFEDCSALVNVRLNDSITEIGDNAFKGCALLYGIKVEDVTISTSSVTIPGSATRIGNSAFKDCERIAYVEIPESVTEIGDSVFEGCTSLEEITLPESLTEIGNSAFSGCSALEIITIPDTVTSIGSNAFANCPSLVYVDYTGNADGSPWGAPQAYAYKENDYVYDSNKKETLLGYTGKNTSIVIPRGVIKIAEDSFTYFPFLDSVYIPDSVTEIAEDTFRGTYSLKTIYYNGSAEGAPWGAPNASVKSFDEELIEEADPLQKQAVSVVSEEVVETSKGDVRQGNLRTSLHNLSDKSDMYGPVEVPKIITKEYERRIKVGFKYEPEKVYNDYSAFSDAEIIEMINERLFELHNEKRAELGLNELKWDKSLYNVATIRAEESSYFFNHTRPNGKWCDILIPWNEIEYQVTGENLSWQLRNEASILKNPRSIVYPGKPLYLDIADDAFEGLLNSPPHYANITHPEFKYIGIDSYIVRNTKGEIMVVVAFEFCSGAMY